MSRHLRCSGILVGGLWWAMFAAPCFAQSTIAPTEAEKAELDRQPAPADPVLWLRSLPKRDAAVASFQEISPGTTKFQDVQSSLGSPKEQMITDDGIIMVYEIGPFPRVKLTVRDDVVAIIHAELRSPQDLGQLIKELDLERYSMAADHASQGAVRNIVVPDRGLRFVLTEDTPPRASAIRLESPRADDFVLRARSDESLFFREQLADLEQALRLDPGHAEALVRIARLWDRLGYAKEARLRLLAEGKSDKTAEPAIAVRLELARLAYRIGDMAVALQEFQSLQPQLAAQPETQCRADLVLADIYASQQPPLPTKQVLDQYFRAIQSAQTCLKDATEGDPLEAHEVLLEAHLGAARFISRSSFRNKGETVAKWLTNATGLLRRDATEDIDLPAAGWSLWLASLECHVALGGSADTKAILDQATRNGDKMLGEFQDDLAQRYVRTSYGRALLLGARSLLAQGDATEAANLAHRGAELLATTAQQQPPHAPSEALLGQCYFLLGSLDAIVRRDHRSALKWYERALPLIDSRRSSLPDTGPQEIAEQMVSIGLSYWETGSRGEALRWTERGLALVQEGIQQGRCPESAQSVACGNLAFMYDALGQKERSQQMAALARRLGNQAEAR